jgi:hypothetical protein
MAVTTKVAFNVVSVPVKPDNVMLLPTSMGLFVSVAMTPTLSVICA